MPSLAAEGIGHTDRFSVESTGAEWRLGLSGFDWSRITGARAFCKPLTHFFAKRLPTVIDRQGQRLVLDITALPPKEEFRFWLVLTLDHDVHIRLPDNNAWLIRR